MNVIVQNNNSHHYSHAEHKGLFTGESTPVLSEKHNKRQKHSRPFTRQILKLDWECMKSEPKVYVKVADAHLKSY